MADEPRRIGSAGDQSDDHVWLVSSCRAVRQAILSGGVRAKALLLLFAGCDGGRDPRVVLRILTPTTDPFAEATSVRVTFDSEPPVVVGPAPIDAGSVDLSLDLPSGAAAGRLVVEALGADGAVVGHGATPPVQPMVVAGLEVRVLVSKPVLPEEGPTQPPEPLGAPAGAALGEEWFAVTAESGAILVYDLLLHEWITDVAEPPNSISDATAVSFPDRSVAFAGGLDGEVAIYQGLSNSWRVVPVDGGAAPWTRPARIDCADGSTLFAGGGTDQVVRLALDGAVTLEAPMSASRAGMTASGELVVGGAPGNLDIEVVRCDGTREVVDGVGRSDRVGHGAARLADGSVLVAGGTIDGAPTDDAILLPPDCAPGSCEPIASGPLLPEPRTDVVLVALPEGGAMLQGGGEALSIDPDSWVAIAVGGDPLGPTPAVFPVPTGDLAGLQGDRLSFVAPRVLFE
jgi:hypothetical protein